MKGLNKMVKIDSENLPRKVKSIIKNSLSDTITEDTYGTWIIKSYSVEVDYCKCKRRLLGYVKGSLKECASYASLKHYDSMFDYQGRCGILIYIDVDEPSNNLYYEIMDGSYSTKIDNLELEKEELKKKLEELNQKYLENL